MGLTKRAMGRGATLEDVASAVGKNGGRVVALAGNPNVGKSTLFNALTGLRQHTGNWSGKTVVSAQGTCRHQGKDYQMVDLPGTYSLATRSQEEEVARAFIQGGQACCTVVVCDGTCLERNLNLALQIIGMTNRVVVCVNMMDEAAEKGLTIDLPVLGELLGVPVVGTSAGRGRGLAQLMDEVAAMAEAPRQPQEKQHTAVTPQSLTETVATVHRGQTIASRVVQQTKNGVGNRDRRLDKWLTSRRTGIPLMLLLLGVVLWLTIAGANLPSALLSSFFEGIGVQLAALMSSWGAPWWLQGALVDGVYRVLTWVVAVMLPPMAIFFPLFTLLEDFGYLPRVAFVLDHAFQKAKTCGKQALTMCMVGMILRLKPPMHVYIMSCNGYVVYESGE